LGETGRAIMNYVKKLWRGEERLWVTYWFFGALGNIAFIVLSVFLGEFGFYDAFENAGLNVWLVSVAYGIFMFVAIWKSAGNYEGKRIWSILARVAVVIAVLRTLGGLARDLQQTQGIY
jgi:hypothetical protein